MKLPRAFLLASLATGSLASGRAADAIQAVDYTRKDLAFTPAATVTPPVRAPQTDTSVQGKRVDISINDKALSTLAGRRAAVDLQEAQAKNVLEKDSRRPEAREAAMSGFNHRESVIATVSDARKPEMVSKYQASLSAASASNMARFPAAGAATTAKLNRFVFRKNSSDAAAAVGLPITPAAGQLPVQK